MLVIPNRMPLQSEHSHLNALPQPRATSCIYRQAKELQRLLPIIPHFQDLVEHYLSPMIPCFQDMVEHYLSPMIPCSASHEAATLLIFWLSTWQPQLPASAASAADFEGPSSKPPRPCQVASSKTRIDHCMLPAEFISAYARLPRSIAAEF